MDFTYTNNPEPYRYLFSLPLKDFRCKHVLSRNSRKADQLYALSAKYGYPQCMWGYGSGIYVDHEANRTIQIHTIRRMIYKGFTRPFRVVLDSAGVPWIDNLHSAIRDILVFGEGCTLWDTRFYLIDLSGMIPGIVDVRGSVSGDMADIKGALESAFKRDMRTNDEIRKVFYTIGEFMADNEITRDAIHLKQEHYEAYLKQWQRAGKGAR